MHSELGCLSLYLASGDHRLVIHLAINIVSLHSCLSTTSWLTFWTGIIVIVLDLFIWIVNYWNMENVLRECANRLLSAANDIGSANRVEPPVLPKLDHSFAQPLLRVMFRFRFLHLEDYLTLLHPQQQLHRQDVAGEAARHIRGQVLATQGSHITHMCPRIPSLKRLFVSQRETKHLHQLPQRRLVWAWLAWEKKKLFSTRVVTLSMFKHFQLWWIVEDMKFFEHLMATQGC